MPLAHLEPTETKPLVAADAGVRSTILVVEDDDLLRSVARASLEQEGYRVVDASSGEAALELFSSASPDLVLLDVQLPGIDGFDTCAGMRESMDGQDAPIVLVTSLQDTTDIERAYEVGATDFVTKPVRWMVLNQRVKYMLRASRLAREEAARQLFEKETLKNQLKQLQRAVENSKLIHGSTQMDAILTTLRQVAPTDVTVLITGESGTGKELFARTLHELSARKNRPIVTVDCSAISSSLIESELFGHEKGAFTDAASRRKGRLAEADTGTVFLDEVGELPLEVQSKLLRFVQERQFTKVGGSQPQEVDVRVVAATNRNLREEVAAGRFREDLFYRLNVITLEIPALRERQGDATLLARHFVRLFSLRYQKPIVGLAPETEALIRNYEWPGNVRELQNRILQAVVLADNAELRPCDLRLEEATVALPTWQSSIPVAAPRDETVATEEEETRESSEDPLSQLATSIEALIAECSDDNPPPLGRWLANDLVLIADRLSEGVVRQGALRLGIPQTTYRRHLLKLRAGSSDDASSSLPQEVLGVLESLVTQNDCVDLPSMVERVLLESILRRHPRSTSRGSRLLGATAPTFRRRVAELACQGTIA